MTLPAITFYSASARTFVDAKGGIHFSKPQNRDDFIPLNFDLDVEFLI